MKTITFKEAQNLLKSNICKNYNGDECVVSTSVDGIMISWKNKFYEFSLEKNATVEYLEHSIRLNDFYNGLHTFQIYKLIPVKI
jgi:hypothetical protein